MTMSTQCKWLSFSIMSFAVICLLLLFHGLAARSKCDEEGHIRDRDSKICYKKSTVGPCEAGTLMEFLEEEYKSIFGECRCPVKNNRTMVLHGGKCYYIFSQGDCPDGHWLNITKKGEPICELNPCIQPEMNGFEATKNANDDGEVDYKSADVANNNSRNHGGNQTRKGPEWVPVKNGCARLYHYEVGCPEGSVVRFYSRYIRPSCFEPPPPTKYGTSMGAIGVGAYTSCPLGSAKAITGICQPHFEFDFDEPTKPDSKKS